MVYRFGEFELSEEDFSLRCGGRRVPLEPRALGVLIVLVGSPGKLLGKQVLLQAVWKDTFVEETTLTRAIALIRKVLGDDAREPRYIETVPTKGYRFINPVELCQPAQTAALVEATDTAAEAASVAGAPGLPSERYVESVSFFAGDSDATLIPHPAWKLQPAILAVAAVLLVVCGTLFYSVYHRHRPALLSAQDTLVLADFRNTTGDASFDAALRQGLMVELEQSPVLRLASDFQVRKTLKRMGRREDDALTAQVSQEVCQRLGGSVVLDGSVSKLGSSFVVGLRARRCGSGEELDAEQVQVGRKEDALNAISKVATQFRERLGEAAATLHGHDTPLADATTPSLEALNAFSRGMQAFNISGSSAAIPLFRYATELDPDFAWAHAWLGRMYADLGREELAVQSTRRAHDLRNRASERERFTIDVSYDLLVTGNLNAAREACNAWMQMYPRDVYPRAFLATTIYPAFGQYERALAESRQMIALDPDFVVGYRDAAISLIALNRADEARGILQAAAQRKVYLPSFVTDAYRIAFLRGDSNGMEQALKAAPRNPWLLYYHSATLARAGRLQEARQFQERALSVARQSSRQDMEAELLVAAAHTDLFYGYPDKSAQAVRTALKLQGGRYTKASGALVLAMAGHADEASLLADRLRKEFPEDTVLQHNFLPSIQAAAALNRKKPQVALNLLESASQPEVNLPLYPTYLRGQAQLALGHAPEAAATFRTILDRPGVVLNDPLWNVVQLDLAKAYALSGDRQEAIAVARAVRQEWTGAQQNFPALQKVRVLTRSR